MSVAGRIENAIHAAISIVKAARTVWELESTPAGRFKLMASTESGWTKEFPRVDGDYFTRDDEGDSWVIPVRISEGQVFEFGLQGDCRHLYDNSEYLGPFTASDAEQLIELRKIAERALTYIETDPVRDERGTAIMQRLRAVLNPKQPEKETQS